MSETERILCMGCGKSVSTPVPKDTIVRAYVECPECLEIDNATLFAKLRTDLETSPLPAPALTAMVERWRGEIARVRERLENSGTSEAK